MISPLFLAPDDWLGLLSRLFLALLVGGIIGCDRELRNKPAGFRTHIIVSFAAALFVMVPIILEFKNSDSISRVIQGVATGVGFLGAGQIITSSSEQSNTIRVRGLTSAAAIWASAALGITAGCGLWQLSLIGALFCFIVLRVMKKFEIN